MIATARRLRRLFDLNRPRWYALAVLVMATSAMEALAAVLVFALINLLASHGIRVPLIGQVTTGGGGLTVVVLGIAGFFVLRAGLVVLHDTVLYRSCYGAGTRLEEALLRGYLTLPPREIRRRGHAELVRNVHDTVIDVVEDCLIPAVLGLGHLLTAIGIIAVMAGAAPVPALVAGLVFAPLLLVIAHAARRPVRRLGEEVEDALASSLRTASETLALAAEIRMAGRAEAFAGRFGTARRRIARAGGAEEVIKSFPRLASETLLVLFVIGYVVVVTAHGDATAALPTLGLFAYAALRVLPSVIGLVGLVHAVAHSAPAVATILADEPLLRRPPAPAEPAPAPRTLALRDVTVRLPEAGRSVLQGVDLTLHRGDVVAVVGANGAGKSTLIDVLAGILPPSSGTVTVDHQPLRDVEDGWSRQVAMVTQHVHLLDADIPTNITLDPSGASATDPRVSSVIGSVGLQPVVDRLRGRTVGEDGRALSGGERQRVAVARALHRRAGVLLVDEGTSALDTAGRSLLMDLVGAGSEERITVLVTHDPEVIRACNRVVRVDAGRVRMEEPVPR